MLRRWARGCHCLVALSGFTLSPSCRDTPGHSAQALGSEAAAAASRVPRAAGSAQPTPPAAPFAFQAPGLAVRRGSLPSPYDWGFVELSVDLRQVALSIVRPPAGIGLLPELPAEAWAWVNGGYFDAEFRPTTWVRSGGRDWTRKRRSRSGGVLLVEGERGYVGPNWELPFEPRFALQSSPLIVEPRGLPGIRSDDGRRAARTFVCQGQKLSELRFILVLAAIGGGPTLFECMELARKAPPAGFGCQVALNLDGGPSTGVRFAPEMQEVDSPPVGSVAYAVAFSPKQSLTRVVPRGTTRAPL